MQLSQQFSKRSTTTTTKHPFLNTNRYIHRGFEWKIAAIRWQHARNHHRTSCRSSMNYKTICEMIIHSTFRRNQRIHTERSFHVKKLKFSYDKLQNSHCSSSLILVKKRWICCCLKLEARNLYESMKHNIVTQFFWWFFWYYMFGNWNIFLSLSIIILLMR